MATKKNEKTAEDRAHEAIRHWITTGDPIKARDIKRALDAGEDVDPALLNLTSVRPRAGVDMEEVGGVPPRTGKGSGVDNWREFAKSTSDMDPEVIDSMSKDDIVAALESTGVIPAEEDEEDE